MALADLMVVMDERPDPADRHAARGVRAAGAARSSRASSAATTCCRGSSGMIAVRADQLHSRGRPERHPHVTGRVAMIEYQGPVVRVCAGDRRGRGGGGAGARSDVLSAGRGHRRPRDAVVAGRGRPPVGPLTFNSAALCQQRGRPELLCNSGVRLICRRNAVRHSCLSPPNHAKPSGNAVLRRRDRHRQPAAVLAEVRRYLPGDGQLRSQTKAWHWRAGVFKRDAPSRSGLRYPLMFVR